MEHNLSLHGMHCDSCAKIIERTVKKHDGASVKALDMQKNTVTLVCGQEQLAEIKNELRSKGYQLLTDGEEAKEGYEAGSIGRGI
ncbi:MAG TPA: heavy metal-associated domain-containing protein, partial [Candidatus Micrarchaeota archaeon]|nr:heavy metal-associated domain-containing protein [Candidatus Micrarchaeota archaeon]